MHAARKKTAFLVLANFWFAAWLSPAVLAQQAGGVAATESRFRLIRSMSGGKGKQQGGSYVIEDPRTVFYVPDDRQVIVLLEWDGPPGKHQFEGLWKNPEGKVVVISDFTFEAKERRFGGYWSLAISDSVKTGLWTLEARINGETTGSHTFQILAGAKPADLNIGRRMLTPAEIYQVASAASVFIEKLDAAGRRAQVGTGFFVGDNLVVTTFQNIDGAMALRLILPSGERFAANQVLAWNRQQDWALIRSPAQGTKSLELVKGKAWTIGDRCYSLDVQSATSRIIQEGSLIGETPASAVGSRLSFSFSINREAIGSPVLNEFSQAIGILGATLVHGALSADSGSSLGYFGEVGGMASRSRGTMAVPASLVRGPSAGDVGRTLEELHKSSEFIPLVLVQTPARFGSVGSKIRKESGFVFVEEQRSQFSRRDKEVYVVLQWEPQERQKSTTSLRIYDTENRLLQETPLTKVDLKPRKRQYTSWKVGLTPAISPGLYRVDVLLGQDTAWRTFLLITD